MNSIEESYYLSGDVQGARRRFRIRTGLNRVGRDEHNTIVLPIRGVSREHAIIQLDHDRLSIADYRSVNGTFVNGERIAKTDLAAGDRVGLGPLELELHSDEELALASVLASGEERPVADTGDLDTAPAAPRRVAGGPSEGVVLDFPPGHVVGRSAAMRTLYGQMACLLRGSIPVILHGETGVGKEHLARTLHRSSDRGGGPYVALNCAAIPSELLEAEMFGVASGAATGVSQRPGRFQQAHGGTLFLDEIDGMPATLQAKLLRALDAGEIRPVGGDLERVDVRFISATNGDLEALIDRGTFRRDLYYRLAGFELRVPALRERRRDIPALVEHFIRRSSAESGKAVRGVSSAALKALVERHWPGNIRELCHEVRRLVIFCPEGGVIRRLDLPTEARCDSAADGWVERLLDEKGGLDLRQILSAVEKRVVRRALERVGGNKAAAARLLGTSRNGLRLKLERLGLVDDTGGRR